ncbi:sodium/glutamate symporter [Thioalkalivibrio sulfidiphilus]|uniref:sodium/glutamate symporter n=1 Tax=Thioalkalivibrio sulfidiphilus TaxID=1033854 RepID=UPI003B29C40C
MSLDQLFMALVLLGLLMLAGKWLRVHVALFGKLFLPSAILGGALGLLLGPQGFGALASLLSGDESRFATGLLPQASLEIWSGLPGLLISVVFAGLFLGKTIPGPRAIWRRAGPMVAHGQTLAWGQYVIGLSLALLLLTPVFGVSPMAGALIEIGFEGGHGTAAGLAGTFRELGFENGADLALGLATVGVVAGVLLGTILVNWGVRSGRLDIEEAQRMDTERFSDHDERESVPRFSRARSIDPLSIHLGFFALAIAIGWLILQGLIWVESVTWNRGADGLALMEHIPLFPLAMVGGVLVQVALMRLGHAKFLDRGLVNRISGAALDVLIISALATLSLEAVGSHIWTFLILAVAGIAWALFGFLVLAPRMFPKDWFPMGLANFGQGIGMTVIGLLLVRMADPDNRSGAMESFGYKQLLFEPVVGGGLFTALSLPLIYHFGALPVLILCSVLMLGWLVFGLWVFRPEKASSST